MVNGDVWEAIRDLRAATQRQDRELGELKTRLADAENDISDAEQRQMARMDRLMATARWVVALLVPAAFALIGLLLGRAG